MGKDAEDADDITGTLLKSLFEFSVLSFELSLFVYLLFSDG